MRSLMVTTALIASLIGCSTVSPPVPPPLVSSPLVAAEHEAPPDYGCKRHGHGNLASMAEIPVPSGVIQYIQQRSLMGKKSPFSSATIDFRGREVVLLYSSDTPRTLDVYHGEFAMQVLGPGPGSQLLTLCIKGEYSTGLDAPDLPKNKALEQEAKFYLEDLFEYIVTQ